jgi:hypothetical protein
MERLRCEHCGRLGCDWIGDVHRARAEAAEAEVARLQAALAESREAHAYWYDVATRLRAALARIDTDEARQAVAEALLFAAAGTEPTEWHDLADAAVRALLAHITDTTEETPDA